MRRPSRLEPLALPPADLVFADGDELLVLATLSELRRVELGILMHPSQKLRARLKKNLTEDSLFEVNRNFARYLGYTFEQVRKLPPSRE